MVYSPYMMVKYTLHWMVIVFNYSGEAVCNGVSSSYHMIATYEGTPYKYRISK